MTATLNDVANKKPAEESAEQQAAAELVRLAQEQGLSLTGPDGLLKQLTKTVLETALNEEMTEHLGYDKHDRTGPDSGNIRNGTRSKTVLTEATGHVEIDVPRDRAGTFAPQIVKKRQRRLSGVDEVVLSLYAKGLTTGEISAHFAEIYGASVSKETVSRITDKVIEELNDWSVRPLDEIYAAVFIDAIVVKIRDGQVANRPVYAAIGVTLDGERDILGLWAGTGGEGAKFWMSVLTDLRNRGVRDVFFVVCDGLKGPPRGGPTCGRRRLCRPHLSTMAPVASRAAPPGARDRTVRAAPPASRDRSRATDRGRTSCTRSSAEARFRTSRPNTTAAAAAPPITEAYEPDERRHAHAVVELAREHDVGAAVVAGDDHERDLAREAHDGAGDLRAHLQHAAAHGLRRAVEARQVRQDHGGPIAARGVERARDLLRRMREQRRRRPRRRGRRSACSRCAAVCRLSMPISVTGSAADVAVPDDGGLGVATSRASARGSRRPRRPRARISGRIANGRLRPGFASVENRSPMLSKPSSPS